MNRISPSRALPIGLCVVSLFRAGGGGYAATPGAQPIHVFCGTGDHLWSRDRKPVDSRAVVEAMVEWMHDTYGVQRLYWRGAQDQLWHESARVGEDTPQCYGDGCTRPDVEYGWRRVGNLIRTLGPAGDKFIEECIARRDDKWLAWIAYEVKYLEQKRTADKFCLVDEAQAIADARKAPPFPGWTR
jgi:hypothetical protein